MKIFLNIIFSNIHKKAAENKLDKKIMNFDQSNYANLNNYYAAANHYSINAFRINFFNPLRTKFFFHRYLRYNLR